MCLGEMAQISQWGDSGEVACRHMVWGMIVGVMIWEWWVVVHEEWGNNVRACMDSRHMMRCCSRSTEDCHWRKRNW